MTNTNKHKRLDSITISKLRNEGMSINELARKYKCSPTTIYYHLRKISKYADALTHAVQVSAGGSGDGK
jgi:Mor family transcriptional regulator